MKSKEMLLLGAVLCLGGCASWNSENGIENRWRSGDAPEWVIGTSTETEVTQAFGPPSQVIALGDRTVFYYLREDKQGKALFLLLWNWGDVTTTYDRAIFFFEPSGILTHYAYSREAPADDAK